MSETLRVYVPVIYGRYGYDMYSYAVGVFLTEKEAYQALCDKLCDEKQLFPCDSQDEKRVVCRSREELTILCKTNCDAWYKQGWFWKMQDFPRMPLHFDLI